MRAKTAIEINILDMADPLATQMDLAIVRVRLFGREGRKVLQIMAERPADGQISIDQCAALSRALSAAIDVADPVGTAFELEVSSPGMDRPLTRWDDFIRWDGFLAKVELDRLVEGRRRFKGTLRGVEDDNIVIDLEGETDSARIPFAWLSDAHLEIDDHLLKHGAAKSGASKQGEIQ